MYRFITAFVLAASLSLTACAIPVKVVHDPAVADQNDCAGTDGICLVSDHDKKKPLTADLLDKKIHDYLENHPAELAQILGKAQAAVNQQIAAEKLARVQKGIVDYHDEIFNDSTDPILGNPKGDVTIVEYFDNECPYCKKLAPEIEKLLALDPNVRVIMKEFPILDVPGVAMSTLSTKYALAADRQHRYAEFHTALMASTIQEHQLSEDNIKAFAKAAGLNMTKLEADIQHQEIAQHIATNRKIGGLAGVDSTPTLIVGGQPHATTITADQLEREISAIRRKQKTDAQAKAAP